MKKIMLVLILLFSSIVFANTQPDVIDKTETHGKKHKSLPKIPSDSEATEDNDYSSSRYVKRISKNKQCVNVEGGLILIGDDGMPTSTHPCVEWQKEYENGKLQRYESYKITALPDKSSFYVEHTKDAVVWDENGQILHIKDEISTQSFDEMGNLERECTGTVAGECEEYDETTGQWITSFWIS